MKQGLWLVVFIATLLLAGFLALGYDVVHEVGYGAISLMGLMVAGTFLWLYLQRATPLALGMAFSWAGASLVLGWWWAYALLEAPGWMENSPFHLLALALYLAGATLHFSVINRSFGGHGARFLWPVLGAVGLSAVIAMLS